MSDTGQVDPAVAAAPAAPAAAPQAPALGAADAAVESRARRMGWVPHEQWRGDGHQQWVDAGTFVARAEASTPVLIERFRKMDGEYAATQRELTATKAKLEEVNQSMQTQLQVMDEFRQFASKTEERAYKRARREIEGRMGEAVKTADEVGFQAAQRDLAELEQDRIPAAPARPAPAAPAAAPAPVPAAAPAPAPAEPAASPIPPPPVPEIQEWFAANPWFIRDTPAFSPMLHGAAIEEDVRLQREHPAMPVGERLRVLDENLRKMFPQKFGVTAENPARRAAAPVNAGGEIAPASGGGKKYTYNDLPKEAKEACDRFVKNIPNYKREAYVEMYFADQE